jgi:ABC-type glycerol-3-phosphate transport system substrate-binding protein
LRKSLTFVVALLLGAVMAACSAPGTNSTDSANSPVQIEFWNTLTGPLENDLTSIVHDFESTHPNITVKLVYQPYDSMLQALQTAAAAGKPPALAQLELTQMAQLASDQTLAPISDLLSSQDAASLQKSIIPSIAAANSSQGKLYTVPFGYNSNVLYYNKTLLQQAGISEQDMPKTWADLERVAGQLTKNGVYGYAFPAQAPWILEVRMWQAGAELFDQGNKKATFDSPQGVAMLNSYQQLLNTKAAEMVQADSSLDQLTDLFAAGKVAMFEQSSTSVQSITGKAKFDVGVAPFPTMGKQVYSMGGYNLGIFDGAPDNEKRAAAEFAQWWASPQIAAKWTTMSNYLPGIQAAWNTDTLKQWEQADPRRAVAANQLPEAHTRPNLPGYPQIANDLADAFEATMSGQGSAQANLSKAAGQADQIIANSN